MARPTRPADGAWLEDLGVKQAKVTLTRLDCGPDAP